MQQPSRKCAGKDVAGRIRKELDQEHRWHVAGLGLVCVLFYIFLVDEGASIVRAAIMLRLGLRGADVGRGGAKVRGLKAADNCMYNFGMDIMKNYKLLLIFPLMMVVIIFFFFYRMSRNDDRALVDFPVAYTSYDQAISDFSKAVLTSNASTSAVDNLEHKVDETLVVLNTKASVRISSLTKNDGDLMKVSLDIAGLAGKEFDALKAYQSAVSTKNSDLEQLAREFRDFTNQRQAAYSRYLALAGR